jgi:hypothetical protein
MQLKLYFFLQEKAVEATKQKKEKRKTPKPEEQEDPLNPMQLKFKLYTTKVSANLTGCCLTATNTLPFLTRRITILPGTPIIDEVHLYRHIYLHQCEPTFLGG